LKFLHFLQFCIKKELFDTRTLFALLTVEQTRSIEKAQKRVANAKYTMCVRF
jgi:ribosomal protein L29